MNHSISLSRLQALLRIAERAVELHKLEDTRRSAQVSLADACRAYRAENALGGYIEKHTPQWDAMMDAVSGEHGVLAGYKKAEYNGKRRLATAVRAYLNGGVK